MAKNSEQRPFRQGQPLPDIARRSTPAITPSSAEEILSLSEIYPTLKEITGHDFSRYKQSTVMRRIQRRMQAKSFTTVAEYASKLRLDPDEAENLFKDLLISVTQFFRDRESFDFLRDNVLNRLLSEVAENRDIRIWVPGCATGEEAYSIAILLRELMAELNCQRRVQVFATDLDAEALDYARKGMYSEAIVDDLSAERLATFFQRKDSGFEVVQELREMCIFSSHNLIKDPPFSKIDLISCRNVLIYLEADIQKDLLPIFHYSLNPSGYLFLGPSENIAAKSGLFRTIDQKHRVYQRQPTTLPPHPRPSLVDGGRLSRSGSASALPASFREPVLTKTIERVLIEEFTSPSVIINDQGDVLYFSGKADRYLKPATGVPSNKLFALARKPLRFELRSAVQNALSTRKPVVRKNLAFTIDNTSRRLNLIVRPVHELGKNANLFIVIFDELARSTDDLPICPSDPLAADDSVLHELEEELRTTKEHLQNAIEELETSNEELKSANEELLSMNEELQSSNEELQTSKEEVQTANDELQRKIEEVNAAHEELTRTLERISDGFVAFDLRWRYTFINSQAHQLLFKLGRDTSALIGRCVWEVFPEYIGTETYLNLHRALELQTPISMETLDPSGKIWLSIKAYPGKDGLSVYFQDITERKLEEERLREQASIDAFTARIGTHLTQSPDIDDCLGNCAQALVDDLKAAFGRIWLFDPADNMLLLKASAGMYTHLNGAHARIPLGQFKIGMIAAEKRPHLTNSVIGDPRVPAQEWAKREGIVSFAGYPLTVEDRLVGVIAMFARHELSNHTLRALESVSNLIAVGVERIRAEEALRNAEHTLERTVHERTSSLQETIAELEAFSYSVSHDLRSPLRAMEGYANALLEDCSHQLDPTCQTYLERISRGAARLDRLTLDVLTYSRLSRTDFKPCPINLDKLVADILEQYPQFQQFRSRIHVRQPLLGVVGHEAFLTQCVANLIGNAVKFVAKGATPEVQIWTEAVDPDSVRLCVKDNGIGIAPEHKDRIFQIFGRVHHNREYEGTGIGLSVVKRAIQKMGGQVGYESELGRGSCFWIQLPAA